MIAILTSSDLPPTPIVGATSGKYRRILGGERILHIIPSESIGIPNAQSLIAGGSTAVGMVGLHPILRSLLAEGENLQAMWPFTESSPQLNYSETCIWNTISGANYV